jgi:hypothetical protein
VHYTAPQWFHAARTTLDALVIGSLPFAVSTAMIAFLLL